MKTLVFAFGLLAIVSCQAIAQGGGVIGLFVDPDTEDCYLDDTSFGIHDVYVVYYESADAVALEFRLQSSSGNELVWLGDNLEIPGALLIGDSQTGCAIGFGDCLPAPQAVLRVQYLGQGFSDVCASIDVVEADFSDPPALQIWDCFDTNHPSIGGRLVINPDGSCECGADLPETGSVTVDTTPDALEAPWHLSGPGVSYDGYGDETLTEQPAGAYTVTWSDVTGYVTPALQTQTLTGGGLVHFSGTYEDARPLITSIVDIPGDQGGNVRMIWTRSQFDAPGNGIDVAGYGVFRRQDNRLEGWDFLVNVPANGDDIYQYVAPTLCDSTEAGICWSTFFIRTLTDDPFTYYDTAPDSGYSVDNLAPAVPGNVTMPISGLLTWDSVPDQDFNYYTVYAAQTEAFDDPIFMSHTTETSYDAYAAPGAYLGVTASDFAGNESGFAVVPNPLTGAGHDVLPQRTTLLPAQPNPFNPTTTIRWTLAETVPVSLRIYDVSGRLVRVLIAGGQVPAGYHEISWDGRDDNAQLVPAGVYLTRLDAGAIRITERVTMVK